MLYIISAASGILVAGYSPGSGRSGCGVPVKSLGKIIRSVRAFGRELSNPVPEPKGAVPIPRIGLALGGGFARGIAHVGILKVLEEEKIPISFVAGTAVDSQLNSC